MEYKPVAFVGYGGLEAVRAIQTERLLFSNFSMMPIPVPINFIGVFRPAVETFKAEEKHERVADRMLEELQKWAKALLPLHRT